MRQMYIYSLRDPDTKQCMWVGQTWQLKDRLRCHIQNLDAKSNPPKGDWLAGLKKPPVMEILEYYGLQERDAYIAENYWIAEMLRRGEPLLNIRNRPK